jgi:uncharacterized protein
MNCRPLLLLLLLYSTAPFAQPQQPGAQAPHSSSPPHIRLLSRAKKNSILLRWAVTTPAAWSVSNRYGFRIERYTVLRNNKMLAVPEKKVLSEVPVRPRPLEEWEPIVKGNNYAAVMAQAIYGKDFEVTGGPGTGMAKMVNKASQLQQRFAMSLYAADNSFEAAKYAGWGWEDSTARWNEKYLYRVISAVPDSLMHIDSASAYIGMGSGYQPLPTPGAVGAIFGDKTVMLSWDYATLKSYYNSYVVQRSDDSSKTFHPLSGLPVANLNNKEKKPSGRMYFTDSLKDNHTRYQYRVVGISSFGEEGPPSPPVQGQGRQLLAFVPHIRKGIVGKDGWMNLQWEFDSAGNDLISGFMLSRSATAKGEYHPVADHISPQQRQFSFGPVTHSDYYTITAIAREGASRISFPQRILLVDSVPPAAPSNVTATIDTNGVVTVQWAANQEPDLLGYRILRGVKKDEELAVLTSKPWEPNQFRDTVSLKMLNDKLYYAVVALDQHYNRSPKSAIVEVKKPDRIPPVSPVITAYKVMNAAVRIDWVNSTDRDVAAHELYRKGNDSSGQPLLVARFTDTTRTYTDRKTMAGRTYTYYLLAIDSAGLHSPPSPAVSVSLPADPAGHSIRSLDSYVDREHRYIELSWSDAGTGTGLREYQLYRGSGHQAVSLWKVIPASERRRVVDEGVTVNTKYEYGIRAIGRDGTVGPYTAIEVNY